MSRKYIFVTGGVLSGVGKGITAASIGSILQAKGLSVTVQKCDPYLNVDAGMLNPAEHGECFVTKDGAETDLDLGHYERFLDVELTRDASTLAGRLLMELIQDERAGKYGGKTVQYVPHLTNKIQDSILNSGGGSDIHIVEVGGTVGDYEGLSFIEAIREFSRKLGSENCLYVHVVYVPYIASSGEFKTKPAQNALRDLRGFGIVPDCVVVRTEESAPQSVAEKIALFGGVEPENVIIQPNVESVYAVPLRIASSDIHKLLDKFTGIKTTPDMSKWHDLLDRQTDSKSKSVTVGIVAKYLENDDTYISVVQALKAAGWARGVDVNLLWLNAETVEVEDLELVDSILVPGGFGERGVEGKVRAAAYALEHKVPYFGICLGLQVSVIAAARRAGLIDAHSTEFQPDTKHPVVYIMEDQVGLESTGGTLRLGDYPAVLKADSLAAKVYGETEVLERHRHRYEVNSEFADSYESGGLVISGTSPDGKYVEYVEGADHPFFIATQAHPEFKSRPYRAHPLFDGFVAATLASIDK